MAKRRNSHPMDHWHHRRPRLTSLYLVCCLTIVIAILVVGQFAAIAFPSCQLELQLQLQVCHFARRDHVEAKGKVGENPEKWPKISQYLCLEKYDRTGSRDAILFGLVLAHAFGPGGSYVRQFRYW